MYVIRDKQTKSILEMVQSAPGDNRAVEEVYPSFDAETMEVGRSEEPAIPAWFTIENGVVKEVEPAEDDSETRGRGHAKQVAPPLEEAKATAIAYYSDLAFQLRRAVVPDYKLQNAALGVYDESETAAIRDTVKAFRDEFYRIKGAIEKARSIKAVKEVTPNFPGEPARPSESARASEPARAEPRANINRTQRRTNG